MKLYYKRPVEEFRFVKPDPESMDYEVWVLTPVCIGGLRKTGTSRILTDDGLTFANMQSAASHLLATANRSGLAELARRWSHTQNKRESISAVSVKGPDLIATGKWPQFCKLKGVDPRDVKMMQSDHTLTLAEAEALGIKKEPA